MRRWTWAAMWLVLGACENVSEAPRPSGTAAAAAAGWRSRRQRPPRRFDWLERELLSAGLSRSPQLVTSNPSARIKMS